MIIDDDLDALIRRTMDLGPEFWNLDFETSAAIHYLVTRGRTDVVVRAFDSARNRGDVGSTDLLHPELIVALRKAGRNADADRLLRALRRKYQRQRGLSVGRMAGFVATERALSGDKAAALAALERVQAEHEFFLWNQFDHAYSYLPFRVLASEPRFLALVRAFDAKIIREQKEALARARRLGIRLPYAIRIGNPYQSSPIGHGQLDADAWKATVKRSGYAGKRQAASKARRVAPAGIADFAATKVREPIPEV